MRAYILLIIISSFVISFFSSLRSVWVCAFFVLRYFYYIRSFSFIDWSKYFLMSSWLESVLNVIIWFPFPFSFLSFLYIFYSLLSLDWNHIQEQWRKRRKILVVHICMKMFHMNATNLNGLLLRISFLSHLISWRTHAHTGSRSKHSNNRCHHSFESEHFRCVMTFSGAYLFNGKSDFFSHKNHLDIWCVRYFRFLVIHSFDSIRGISIFSQFVLDVEVICVYQNVMWICTLFASVYLIIAPYLEVEARINVLNKPNSNWLKRMNWECFFFITFFPWYFLTSRITSHRQPAEREKNEKKIDSYGGYYVQDDEFLRYWV